ncbi:MAG: DNA mismatch repair endonuclease MutH [Kangiellaceae bacterium]|nr:DNA mismatch repair endonuclease MutH [Kangiellaceae bacterium]
MKRAEAIAGKTLGDVASKQQSKTPETLLFDKGWIGQFLEHILGATAGSKPEPDFVELGIELKTIPIDTSGKPLESTFVCAIQLMQRQHETWQTSLVKKKLNHVLWLPILSEKDLPIEQRIIGMPLLWQPTDKQERILQTDWEETMDKIMLGKFGSLNSKFGVALQVRPKAANSRVLTDAIGINGNIIKTLPRGFYLRTSFTQSILASLSY